MSCLRHYLIGRRRGWAVAFFQRDVFINTHVPLDLFLRVHICGLLGESDLKMVYICSRRTWNRKYTLSVPKSCIRFELLHVQLCARLLLDKSLLNPGETTSFLGVSHFLY